MSEITRRQINKLHEGQVIKNYKELCSILKETPREGGSIAIHLKEISQYCNLEKIKGTKKYLVKEIYKRKRTIQDNREQGNHNIYVPLVQNILLESMIKADKNTIYISKNNLLKMLSMANKFYFLYINPDTKLTNQVLKQYNKNWDYYQVEYSINTIKNRQNKIITTALNNLKANRIIDYTKQYVCVINNERTIVTDEDELESILRFEKDTLEEFQNMDPRIKSIADICLYHIKDSNQKTVTIKDFYNKVSNKLKNEYGWDHYYSIFKIIVNRKYLKNQLDINIENLKLELNETLKTALYKSSNTNYTNNKDKNKYQHIYRDNFCETQYELIDFFITMYPENEQHEIINELDRISNDIKAWNKNYDLYDPEIDDLFT